MATPINSNSNQAQSAGQLAADMLAKLQANAQGDSASSGAFNAWMEKHALTPDALQAPAQPSPPPKAPDNTAANRDGGTTASRLLEQAINRSRQQALAAARQSDQHAAQASSQTSQPTSQVKAKSDTTTTKTSDSDEDDDTDVDSDKKVTAKTSSTDDSAIVSELTPPPGVKTDDAASMMAWLAGLTHGDPTHGRKLPTKTAAGGAGDGASGGQTSAVGGRTDATRNDPSLLTGQTQAGATASAALDVSTWHAAQSTTAMLQGEAGQSFKAELAAHTGQDPVAGLTGALGMAPGAGLMTNEAKAAAHESATLQAPVGGDTFAQALGDQLTMWVQNVPDNGQMTAELHLNPADLGPIHVKISLEGKDAHVDFAAAAVETRQAIEASMPMLSTAFNDVGLNLAGGDVSAQTSQQGFQQAFNQSGGSASGGSGGTRSVGGIDAGDAPAGRAVAAPRPGRAGGLDLYA